MRPVKIDMGMERYTKGECNHTDKVMPLSAYQQNAPITPEMHLFITYGHLLCSLV